MRILLDACIPVVFRHDVAPAGQVETAKFARLDHLSNGRLLAAMASRFDVLITVDTSIPQQNNLIGRSVAVIVLRVPSNDVEDLRLLVPALLAALKTISPATAVIL
jgi:predicted nuclease of predicted toxin-antitoxin system